MKFDQTTGKEIIEQADKFFFIEDPLFWLGAVSLIANILTLFLAYHIYKNWDKSYIKSEILGAETRLKYICIKFDSAYHNLIPELVFSLVGRDNDIKNRIVFNELEKAESLQREFENEALLLVSLQKRKPVGYKHYWNSRKVGLVKVILLHTKGLVQESNTFLENEPLVLKGNVSFDRKAALKNIRDHADGIVRNSEDLFKECRMDKDEAFMESSNLLGINKHINQLC